MTVLRIFVGWDSREIEAYDVCRVSLTRRASVPLTVTPLKLDELIAAKLYDRPFERRGNQRIDLRDGRPFSTDFSFSRFLVPSLASWTGWALYCDCDFLWRDDVAKLFALRDETKAVMVVKHQHAPPETSKMDGVVQTTYPRKNWSSLILWNCGHPANRAVTSEAVNVRPGSWLHGFRWLDDAAIGDLPEAWNWLEGHSAPSIDPRAVHFTRGGPWFPAWKSVAYADEWWREHALVAGEQRVLSGTAR